MLQDASERIQKLRLEQEALLARDRGAMERLVIDQASALAVQIAQKLLESLPAELATAVFLDAMSTQIKALPAKSRELLVASGSDGGLSIAAASLLSEAQQRQCEKAIESALGTETRILFRRDPRLIAGIELSGGGLVLKNNWQNDLSQILHQLKSENAKLDVS